MRGSARPPEHIRDAVIGRYRFRDLGQEIEVFERYGQLWVQPAGAAASRLLHDRDGRFRVDLPGEPLVQVFDLTRAPAPSFVSIEGSAEYRAERVASPPADP